MNTSYSGQHSIIFNDGRTERNTWVHWYLIPSSPPVIAQPTPTFKYVDIPGMDGSIDLTDYLVGRPTYSDRSGSFSFYADNDRGKWANRKAEIANFLDGRQMKMILTDDRDYYYIGRFFFKEWQPGNPNSTVSIDYRVKPYKYRASDGKPVMIG